MKNDKKCRDEIRMSWEMDLEGGGRNKRIWMGVFLVLVGIVALLKSMSAPLPPWVYTWQMLLIGLGFFLGLSHGFRRGGWFVPMLIGLLFLLDEYFLQRQLRQHIWPILLIFIGFVFMIKSRKKHHFGERWAERKRFAQHFREQWRQEASGYKEQDKDNFIDATSLFSNTRKNILSKDFKGGDIVTILGGTELNLSQADINGEALLEVTTIFGGARLQIPPNWIIKSELVNIFGGIQDKRPATAIPESQDKILILKGTVLFGGIEINSF